MGGRPPLFSKRASRSGSVSVTKRAMLRGDVSPPRVRFGDDAPH